MDKKSEKKRVAYMCSVPEWYGHNVNDMFFRLPEWLFVPVQDFTEEEKITEYKKSTYFFVSGYGHKEEAARAYKEGCVLVGVRADVDKSIPMVECREWDPIDVFITFSFVEWSRVIFGVSQPSSSVFVSFTHFMMIYVGRPCFKIFFLLRAAFNIWRKEGIRNVIIKTRNYFRKVMHI